MNIVGGASCPDVVYGLITETGLEVNHIRYGIYVEGSGVSAEQDAPPTGSAIGEI